MNNTPQILIIDDDSDFANFIFDVAESMHLSCKVTTNSDDFINVFNPDITLIFLDLIIPGIDGIELLRFLGKQSCKSNIILMSGVDKRVLEVAQDFARSIGLSIVERLQKPIRLAELERILEQHTTITPSTTVSHPLTQQPTLILTEDELNKAIQLNQFVLHYQPKMEIATNRLSGVEVLVRWQHPKHGLLFPDEFINLMESFGLIDELGWLIIKRGLSDIQQINSQTKMNLHVAFNLSPYSLHDLTYPDKFIAIVHQSSIKPENIVLEITESGLLMELSSALDIFTRLRMKNIKLSIDDFGTGYAMMQQLKNIPATELKIDKSFVQGMLTRTASRVTVQKCIEIAHALDMTVIAEGIETAEQLEFLRTNKCDYAQGYYISKPLPMPALIAWINASK